MKLCYLNEIRFAQRQKIGIDWDYAIRTYIHHFGIDPEIEHFATHILKHDHLIASLQNSLSEPKNTNYPETLIRYVNFDI